MPIRFVQKIEDITSIPIDSILKSINIAWLWLLDHRRIALGILATLILLVGYFIYSVLITRSAVGTVRPDGDVTKTFPTCAGTGCTTNHYTAVDESTLDEADYVNTGSDMLTADPGEEEFTMGSVAGSTDAVSQVVVKYQAQIITVGSDADTISANIYIDGAYQTAQTATLTTSSAQYTATFTGTWSGDDDLQVELLRNIVGTGPATSRDDDIRIYQVYAEVTYTPSITFEQSAYRFYQNVDSRDLRGVLSNTTSESRIWDMAVDSIAGQFYAAGYDTVGGDNQWRIEKRNVSDGSPVTAFGTNGILQIDPSAGHERIRSITLDTTNGYLYIGSYDNSLGNTQLNLQKRKMSTGALCTAAECGTEFGTAGVVTSNVSSGTDVYESIELDVSNGFIYLGGYDNTNANDQWRIEKRKTSTGALCTAAECGTEFGTAGVVTSNPSSGSDILFNITLDLTNGYIYSIGQDAANTNLQWRVEKRKTSTGALCTAAECGTEFGTAGVVTNNPSATNDVPEDIEVDPSGGYLYIAGWDTNTSGSNMQWRIEKRKTSTGALCTAAECGTEFGTAGVVTNNPSSSSEAAVSMVINTVGGYLLAGGDDQVNGNYQLRLEKRSLSTGSLCTAAECGTEFGTAGVVQVNPSSGGDFIRDIAADSSHVYAGGYDSMTVNNEWRVEKLSISDGSYGWGNPLANQDTPLTLSSEGQAFRLRTAIHIGSSNLAQNGQQFKLQYSGKGAGSCAAPSGNPSTYTDVTSGTPVAYMDNPSPVDGENLAATSTNPTHSADSIITQTYEESNNVTNATSVINVAEDGLWDFALKDNGAPAGTAYCLRIVKSDGSALNSYSVYPEISTTLPPLEQGAFRWFEDVSGSGTPNGGPTNINDVSDFAVDTAVYNSSRNIVRTSAGTLYAFLVDSVDCEIWKSTDGTSWSEQDASNSPSCSDTLDGPFASMAIDSNDLIHLLYTFESQSGTDRTDYSTFNTTTDTFGTAEVLASDGERLHSGEIAVDSNNKPHVVGDTQSVSVDYYNKVSGSWSKVNDISTGLFIDWDIHIAISEDNIPEIFIIDNFTDAEVLLGNANNATSFTTHVLDSTIGGSSFSSMAVDSSGNTWVAYQDENGASDYITLAKHIDADGWTTWQAVVTNSNVGTDPSIAIDGTNIYVFYTDENNDIVYDKYDGSSWSGETVLQAGTYETAKVKWSYYNNFGDDTQIDYLFSDGTDVHWASLGMGPSPTDVGPALAVQDAAYTMTAASEAVRLRAIVGVSADALPAGSGSLKLQYAGKGTGTCTAPSGGTPASYTDVSGSTAIAFRDIVNATDDTSLTANINDPVRSGISVVPQTYNEANPFTSLTAIPAGDDGLWDFALVDNGAPSGSTYCFRIIHSDGAVLTTYSSYPQITTAGSGGPTKAVFTNTARSFVEDVCNGAADVFTLQLQNDANTATNPLASTVVRVSSDSSSYTIYSDDTCSTTATNGDFTFSTAEHTKSVYIIDNTVSAPTWTLTATRQSGDTLTTGTQSYTVTAASGGSSSKQINSGTQIQSGTRIGGN